MSEARNAQSPNAPVIPDKLYFRIGEVARLLDVETHTLRFWESEFPQLKVGKGGTGQRLYRRRDVELVLEIKHLLYEQGYTIPGARQFLQSRQRRKDPARPAPENSAPQMVSTGPRQGGLERIRSELRDLSNLLTASPGSADEAAGTPRVPHRGPAMAPSRRGLHLAPGSGKSRESRTLKPGAHSTLPGLFDPETE